MKKLTVMLEDDLYRAAKVEAARHEQTLRELVSAALTEWLEILEDRELGPLVDEAMAEYHEKGGIPAEEFFKELEKEHERKSA